MEIVSSHHDDSSKSNFISIHVEKKSFIFGKTFFVASREIVLGIVAGMSDLYFLPD